MTDARVHAVDRIDLPRYLGQWFEIGRLPLRYEEDGAQDVTATYSLREDGSVRVDNRCLNEKGEPTQAEGVATLVDDTGAKLEVSFLPELLRWIPFTKGDYWILKIDPDYRVALVGTPDHKNLWLLARDHTVAPATEAAYLDEARAQGFDLSDWIRPLQSGRVVSDGDLTT